MASRLHHSHKGWTVPPFHEARAEGEGSHQERALVSVYFIFCFT